MNTNLQRLRLLFAALVLAPALLLASLPIATAQQGGERGLRTDIEIKAGDGQVIKLYDKSYALLIGVSEYASGWPKLPGVRTDIEAVRAALEGQGFQTVVVLNPTGAQLEEAYRNFIQQYGLGIENRLFFYFAGHGHTINQSYGEDMGYIVPVDAPNPNRDPAGFVAKALDMQSMELYARRIQSKHALFLFDSCFSGSLFALSRAVPDNIGYKTSKPVRQFITSGSADELVPDRSVFREQFIAALAGEADANHDGYVTGSELGDFLQDRVVNYTRNAQHPQYGKIRNPNLDKGDFVFALPKAPAPPAVAASNNPPPAQPTLPASARVDPAQQELAFWSSMQNSTDAEDFKDYLARYPNGLYAGLAKRRVVALTSAPPAGNTARPAATPTGGGAAANTTNTARPAGRPQQMQNRAGIEFVWVPSGSFVMGVKQGARDSAGLDMDDRRAKPAHRVTLADGFYMGKYEVTQAQWRQVMGSNPSYFQSCDSCPVEQVSWDDAQEFTRKLNEQGEGYIYRLPSEAEWEYAARAGTAGPYAGGLDAMAWYYKNSGDGLLRNNLVPDDLIAHGYATHPVGTKQPNAFGLCDMHGNVAEWVQDHYHENYNGAPTDGSVWIKGEHTPKSMIRGGSWRDDPILLWVHVRDSDANGTRQYDIGFRVVAVARAS